MQTKKKIQAVNGDILTVEHPGLDLSKQMSTSTTVMHNGVSHSVISLPSTDFINFANTTAQFSVNGFRTHIVEGMDDTGIGSTAVRYQAIVESDSGVLWLQSYDSADHAADIAGVINPQANKLGMYIEPQGGARIVQAPAVYLEIDKLGVIEFHPLTREIAAQLPEWGGTKVEHGEMFAAKMSRSTPYIIFVSDTARGHVLMDASSTDDEVAELASQLKVHWKKA